MGKQQEENSKKKGDDRTEKCESLFLFLSFLPLSPPFASPQASSRLASHSPKRGTEKSDCPHLNPTYGGNFGHKECHTSTSFLTGLSPRLLCIAACGELCTFTLDVAVAFLSYVAVAEAAAVVRLHTAGIPSPRNLSLGTINPSDSTMPLTLFE
ncbi:hypothetical protein E2C01_067485 [Portunus trituberculatus]|uniref:Uncharacterized protein n=1 Tax=Portunus trituberculatus TaxID=210409 RepID=A0A5B7HV63_PORTR|nr:hypothetical protein [Portunus trituberculatus]